MTNMANVTIANLTSSWTDPTRDYTGLGLNITATSYDPSSKVFRLKVNGNTVFSVDASGTVSAPTIAIANVTVDIASPFNKANGAFNVANAAFGAANSEYTFTNAVYAAVNSAFDVINATFTQSNTDNIRLSASYVVVNSAFGSVNTVGEYANTAGALANQAGVIANGAFGAANQSGVIANAAFSAANNVAPQISPAYAASNQAGVIANAAFGAANQAGSVANSIAAQAGVIANAAFGAANQAGTVANNANTYGNSTYVKKAGDTITGDLVVQGNVTISGNTTYVNTQTLLIGDSLVTLNNDIPVSVAPSENAGLEIKRGSSANVALLWNEGSDKWTFTNDGTNYRLIASNTDVESANNYAGAMANSANAIASATFGTIVNVTASFGAANQSGVIANAGYVQANTARDRANDAYGLAQQLGSNASNSVVTNQTSYNTANGAFAVANAAYGNANSVAVSANNYAGVMANSANAWANTKVSSVTGTSGRITSSGGTTPAIDLASGVVTPTTATGGISALTVDTYGRVTAITGSAGYITSSALTPYAPLAGATFTGLIVGPVPSTSGVGGGNDTGSMSIRGDASKSAHVSFHRAGAYAINMGLDTDNVFRIGGWSDGATGYRMQLGAPGGTHTFTGTVSASSDHRAPIFYDSDDTISRWNGNDLIMRGTSPTIFFRDTDHNSAMIHCNSNLLYILRGGNDTETWTQVNNQWPLYINLTNNDAVFGGSVSAVGSVYSPIFYDSNNTAYYTDPASLSVLNQIDIAGRINQTGPGRTASVTINDYDAKIGSSDLYFYFKSVAGGNGTVGAIQFYRVSDQAALWDIAIQPVGGNLAVGKYTADSGIKLDVSGIIKATSDVRAPIFYDSNDTGYYVDPNADRSTNINGFSARTVEGTKGTYKYNIPRFIHTGDTNYWVGTMGWGTTDWNSVFDWGSGFVDSWSDPANRPPSSSHHVGIQSMHYTNGSARYGFQIAGGTTGNLYYRNVWGGGFTSWKTVVCMGVNENNTGGLYADVMYDSNDTGYYVDPNGTTVLNTLNFNSGYGSAAPAYAIRAWVSFNGTNGTIFASQGVTSVTRNTTGDYRVNFNFTMPDANYAASGAGMEDNGQNSGGSYQSAFSLKSSTSTTTTSCGILNANVDQGDNKDGARIMFMAAR